MEEDYGFNEALVDLESLEFGILSVDERVRAVQRVRGFMRGLVDTANDIAYAGVVVEERE